MRSFNLIIIFEVIRVILNRILYYLYVGYYFLQFSFSKDFVRTISNSFFFNSTLDLFLSQRFIAPGMRLFLKTF